MKSFCIVFLAVLLQLSNGIPKNRPSVSTDPFILNGEDAKIGEFPHQLLLRKYGRFICGAVLISKHQAFTAAHCVGGEAKDFSVIAGVHNSAEQEETQTINIAKVIIHPKYNNGQATFANDFAILTFEKPVKFTPTIQPIYWNDDQNLTFAEERCHLSGWGKSNPPGTPVLQKVYMKIISNEECARKSFSAVIYPGHVCALEPRYGACSGDSGGPMTCMYKGNRILVGVASWMWFSRASCNPSHPTVYARISQFKDFIDQHIIE